MPTGEKMAFCTCSTWYAGRARMSTIAKQDFGERASKTYPVIELTLSRFWWRDTRLAELVQTPPPTFQFTAAPSASPSTSTTFPLSSNGTQSRYSFPYPTTFIPVPYHSSTSLAELDMQIIPAARSVRTVSITLPALTPSFALKAATNAPADAGGMEIEPTFETPNITPPTASTAIVQPDGLLLYVAEASYEPGTSPLSSWIPIQGYDEHSHEGEIPVVQGGHPSNPLDLFQRSAICLVSLYMSHGSVLFDPAQASAEEARQGAGPHCICGCEHRLGHH